MKHILLGLLMALASLTALADRSAVGDGITITLRDKAACSPAMQKHVADMNPPPQYVWKKAVVVANGKILDACYTESDNNVLVIDETGDGGIIPAEVFRAVKST